MRVFRATSTVFLIALLGLTAPVYAGQERPSEKKDASKPRQNEQEQTRPQQPHPAQQHAPQVRQEQNRPKQQPARQTHLDQNKPEQEGAQQPHPEPNKSEQQSAHQPRPEQIKPEQHAQPKQPRQPQQGPQPEHGRQIGSAFQPSPEQQIAQRSAWQQHRAGNWLTNHRTWQERGGYHGYRVPDPRFHGDFGRSHGFRIRGLPFMLENGYPRFQYGGYWVSLVDPWPEYWGDDWYENDEVYVNYVDDGYYLFDDRYPKAGIAVSISM